MASFITGDTAPDLTGTVSADLTGATLEAHIKLPDRTTITKTPQVTDAVGGAWLIEWDDDDLTQVGTHTVEIEVTFSNGRTQTFARSGGRPVMFQVYRQIA